MKRRDARQKALQALFEIDLGKNDKSHAVAHVLEDHEDAAASELTYVRQLVFGTEEHLEEVDTLLAKYLQGWKLDRLARVDLNVLRLAGYELLHEHDVDVATICDEAVELAKYFSTDESGKFVNGVLARILPEVREVREQVNSRREED